jgi:hypothetical protein
VRKICQLLDSFVSSVRFRAYFHHLAACSCKRVAVVWKLLNGVRGDLTVYRIRQHDDCVSVSTPCPASYSNLAALFRAEPRFHLTSSIIYTLRDFPGFADILHCRKLAPTFFSRSSLVPLYIAKWAATPHCTRHQPRSQAATHSVPYSQSLTKLPRSSTVIE